jgi:hypothetical protein
MDEQINFGDEILFDWVKRLIMCLTFDKLLILNTKLR